MRSTQAGLASAFPLAFVGEHGACFGTRPRPFRIAPFLEVPVLAVVLAAAGAVADRIAGRRAHEFHSRCAFRFVSHWAAPACDAPGARGARRTETGVAPSILWSCAMCRLCTVGTSVCLSAGGCS